MNKAIGQTQFVIFDVETTGLNPKQGDRICEIAAIKIKDNNEIERFNSLINPHMPMPLASFQIHGISDFMLKDAPSSKDVLIKFLAFIKESVLTGYNVSFDLSFVGNELGLINKKIDTSVAIIDILKMARRLYPSKTSYSLANFSKTLGIDYVQTHRAMQDVELTKKVFQILLERLKEKNINDFLSMHNLFGLNMGLINQSNSEKISEIIRAIDLKAKLKIKYFASSNGQITQREVIPKEIRREYGKECLVGFCYLRNQDRSFRIENIVSIQI